MFAGDLGAQTRLPHQKITPIEDGRAIGTGSLDPVALEEGIFLARPQKAAGDADRLHHSHVRFKRIAPGGLHGSCYEDRRVLGDLHGDKGFSRQLGLLSQCARDSVGDLLRRLADRLYLTGDRDRQIARIIDCICPLERLPTGISGIRRSPFDNAQFYLVFGHKRIGVGMALLQYGHAGENKQRRPANAKRSDKIRIFEYAGPGLRVYRRTTAC